ncbi:hypothetical protein [Nostoc punctiforme]|uniref:Uncharacterized protein n=2 Tax=Nostoc punctiforme TaxID=272131 RepID=B2J9V0_NOSP7|nr:hypothetical protein [Nostoc punctiforme]ACC81127.1 hypothetical protein Npun_F2573 [Nostoc punctiforme PCC 73102]RCJ41930.1 hypothetical protein A6769_38565 [Nostoc punctiforme NIES-2108]
MIDRETLGKTVRRALVNWAKEQENPPTFWNDSDEYQEVNEHIGEAVQRAILREFADHVVWFSGDDERHAIPSEGMVKLINYVEKELNQSNVNLANLHSSIVWGIRKVKSDERDIAVRFLAFKDDTLAYLRALVLITEMANGDQTHAEKRILLNHLIKQLEGAIVKIRNVENYLLTNYWEREDVFKSDYPNRYWREKVAQLEEEIKSLKSGKPPNESPF